MTCVQEPLGAVSDAPTAVLDRLALVLDAFDGCGALSLAEVVDRTGLPRSSAHRMLDRLVQLNWLRKRGRKYSLGIRLVELGSRAVHQDDVHAAAIEPLHQLYRVTGMVVHLAVLDGVDVVYLEKLGGRLASRVPTRVGGRSPAAQSALGKSLLAFSGRTLPGDSEIRRRGFAAERSGAAPGFGSIAVPIGAVGEATAAISVCGPVRELFADARMVAPVQMAAGATWRNLAAGAGVRPVLQRRNLLGSLPTATSVRAER